MSGKSRLFGARVAAILALFLALSGLARAALSSPWAVTDEGRVRLVAGRADGTALSLGLEFELKPGWKIYWRSPGEAGYPPRIDWKDSQNFAGARVLWPAPTRFTVLGLDTMGYEGEVVLPIAATLAKAGPAHLVAAVDYLTCSEICVPRQATLALDVPQTPADGGFESLINHWDARVPHDGNEADLALAGAVLRAGNPPVLELEVRSDRPLGRPDAFIEGDAAAGFAAPAVREAAADATVLRLPVSGEVAEIPGKTLTVTIVDGSRAITANVVPRWGAPTLQWRRLLPMLGLALLGGLLLNVMPCVLPVLSLKLLAAIKTGREARAVRIGFIATAVGILLSFIGLAGVMIALTRAGISVGWGMQFQSPAFLAVMALIVAVFAANLLGLFAIRLPGVIGDRIGAAPLGNVATGAFATLLATPCSAPFLGTALGFALGAGPVETATVFFAMGLGFAAPYLLVAAVPRLARLLPRPGRWMLVVRRVLGLALAATAVWLVAVLADVGIAAPADEAFWRPFDATALGPLVHDDKVVFVDVGAQWCLTCKVNERLVLDDDAVRQRLAAPNVVAMRADWTRPDPAIAEYLKRFGRYGIPFDAVYGPGAPAGVALPEILTAASVRAALERAAGPKG